jgi:hypothetical protein
MVDLKYIGGIAAFSTCMMIILGLITHRTLHPERTGAKPNNYQQCGTSVLASTRYGSKMNTALFGWRVFCCLWFMGGAWLANWIYAISEGNDPKYWYFTVWNLILIGFYFLFASITSWQSYMDPTGDFTSGLLPSWYTKEWSDRVMNIMNPVYDIAGANAIFVTLVAFSVLDSSARFWNLVNHMSNTVFIIIEMMMNDMRPAAYSYLWSLVWLYTYTCITWILVSTETRNWPYTFMEVEQVSAFIVYSLLVFINGMLFFLWLFLAGKLKGMILKYFHIDNEKTARYLSGTFRCNCILTVERGEDTSVVVLPQSEQSVELNPSNRNEENLSI